MRVQLRNGPADTRCQNDVVWALKRRRSNVVYRLGSWFYLTSGSIKKKHTKFHDSFKDATRLIFIIKASCRNSIRREKRRSLCVIVKHDFHARARIYLGANIFLFLFTFSWLLIGPILSEHSHAIKSRNSFYFLPRLLARMT